jgi:hypothetical protein
LAHAPFGPWRDGERDPFDALTNPRKASKLDGTPFAEFADVEYAAAQLGIDADGKELWELACAFGAHHVDAFGGMPPGTAPSAGTPFVGDAAHDSALAAMIAAEEARRAGVAEPEWSEPTEAEVIALRPLLRN